MPAAEIDGYQRQLDIGQDIAAFGLKARGVNFHREVFSSAPVGAVDPQKS